MLRLRALLALLIIGLFCPLKLLGGDRDLEAVFERRGVKGTMVISSLDGCDTFVHDADRADLRFPAASTFKILNTLIALQEGAVKGRDEVIRWDGTVRDFPDWNRDQTLGSAFSSSCVWYYQELARRVGAEKYRGYIRRCAYGKLGEPFDTATFWLDGTLVISAQEQVAFLRKLCRRTLPFRDSAYETLRGIMAVDDEQGYTLRAKSGWAAGVTPQVGWYVGYVEKGGRVWLFAMNMEVRKREELPLRREIALEALRAKGLID
ncbi:MAG: class D beta-lactamase [Chlorobiaceae bacterium]|nr:class D beta-lactamase [Chlorobiaceae bacterium]